MKYMTIDVGKEYITENGSTVFIKYNTNDMGFPQCDRCFGGTINQNGVTRSAFFTISGIYNPQNMNSGFNIIKELPEKSIKK